MMTGEVGRRCKGGDTNRFDRASLNDFIEIQKKVTPALKDSFGQPIETWISHTKIFANILFSNGKSFNAELVAADQIIAPVLASIRIGWRLDITSEMRVLFRGKIYNISAPLPDSKRRYVDLAVSKGSNNG